MPIDDARRIRTAFTSARWQAANHHRAVERPAALSHMCVGQIRGDDGLSVGFVKRETTSGFVSVSALREREQRREPALAMRLNLRRKSPCPLVRAERAAL